MQELNSFVKEGEVYLEVLHDAKGSQLNNQIISIQKNTCDVAAIHVGINVLLSSNKSVNDIFRLKRYPFSRMCRNKAAKICFQIIMFTLFNNLLPYALVFQTVIRLSRRLEKFLEEKQQTM